MHQDRIQVGAKSLNQDWLAQTGCGPVSHGDRLHICFFQRCDDHDWRSVRAAADCFKQRQPVYAGIDINNY